MAADSYMADAVRLVARQVASSTLSSAIPSSTVGPSAPTMPEPSPTILPTPTPSPTGSSGGVTQSPLLFFVALGFGVVFTNLWIIVGVKYCFRYNARNRALALQAEGDAIDLQNVTPHPRRRRREKKLLSIEEVNRQFPLQKYGTWMASRQSQGLPAEGGVDGANAAAVVEHAQSVRNADGAAEVAPTSPITAKHSMDKDTSKMDTTEVTITPASPVQTRQSIDIAAAKPSATVTQVIESHEKSTDTHILAKLQTNNTTHTIDPKHPDADHAPSDAESDDEDAIHAIHPDVTDHPGDSCAICIDTLADDEDVRGLACGHAFHASCIDPWLTSRRACCPLCKRDYWVPKPRAEGDTEETTEERRRRRREREERRAARDANALWAVRGTRIYLPGRFLGGGPVHLRDDGFARRLPSSEVRRRERAEIRRVEERMAATLQRRAARQQERENREVTRENAGGPRWRRMMPFTSGRQDSEPLPQHQPQTPAEAQLMAQARGETGSQQQVRSGRLGWLNPFGRGVGAGHAIGSGQARTAQQQQPQPQATPSQVEAQTTATRPASRVWIFR